MTAPIIPGAEPFSAEGGPHGALVLHGFTGNCNSMRGIAQALAADGFSVECPLLPGHGTAIDDMLDTRWSDWSGTAEAAYQQLAGRCERVVVAGLSMGGTLTTWLATRHPELAGIACINPAVEPAGPMRDLVQALVDEGQTVMPGIGSDIADPDAHESAYPETPLLPLLSLIDAIEQLQLVLGAIECPVLLITSTNDHVVPPSNSDHLAASVSGPVERVTLDRSYHVATLDYDKGDIERRVVEFAGKVCAQNRL